MLYFFLTLSLGCILYGPPDIYIYLYIYIYIIRVASNNEISQIAARLKTNKIRPTQKKIIQNWYSTELYVCTLHNRRDVFKYLFRGKKHGKDWPGWLV